MIQNLLNNWKILQDVHDTGEILGIYKKDFKPSIGNQVSQWEDLPELKHLQLIYADEPYFGRELRYFNAAPWWYRLDFETTDKTWDTAQLNFSNVDYYSSVWLNDIYLGSHEGYSTPFNFNVTKILKKNKINTLIVKVWSPWDDKVGGGREDRRTFKIQRNMVKGTYEHADTLIQRDVNPVGIYGKVWLKTTQTAAFSCDPDISYTLDTKDTSTGNAMLKARISLNIMDKRTVTIHCICKKRWSGEIIAAHSIEVPQSGEYNMSVACENIKLWNTWDTGHPWLYEISISITRGKTMFDNWSSEIGFRKIELYRDASVTRFILNNRSFYVRGTSYFPDLYISNMSAERYKRDLLAIKAAGFNLIRIHVHVALPVLYELCSQLGIAILQDSEYNWTHPTTMEFCNRFVYVYTQTVHHLKKYSSILCWICMNEPGLEDPGGEKNDRAMSESPGPQLFQAVSKEDPTRPIIKGSYCENDPNSGDSHNYTGSLSGSDSHYIDIFGTTEKLNTEYGIDAPPCIDSLKKHPKLKKQLEKALDSMDQIQSYQYHLIKYYTEHYRMQKYAPNSGYVQFLFNDPCPQSFYGLYDWCFIPKTGLEAIMESNLPIGIFLKFDKERLYGVYAVNDSLINYDKAMARITLTNNSGEIIFFKEILFCFEVDSALQIMNLDITKSKCKQVNCVLELYDSDKLLALNHYRDVFNLPIRVNGHPQKMSHEVGMRLFCE